MNQNQSQILNERAGIGPCMDVKAHHQMLYAIQNRNQFPDGRLCVLRPDLSVVAEYIGIGNARQIEIVGNIAVITAREDGIWLFDLSEEKPLLLSHFQTVEFATGVALRGNLACISCRNYGVQLIDISDPKTPVHISLIRMGEVQSATVSGNILYCGVWGEQKVTVVDIQDPANPSILSEIPLQGRGDGVCVCKNILYAATGQHGRGLINLNDSNDPAFGNGNGVELFDISNPAKPKRINGVLFGRGYNSAIDMWEAALYGETLVVNNPDFGVYGLDPTTLEPKFQFLPPPAERTDAVAGVTAIGKDLFIATARGDLFAARGLEIGEQQPNSSEPVAMKPQPFSCKGYGAKPEVIYSGPFMVRALAETDEALALACVEGGVHLLKKDTLELACVIPTEGFAQDIKFCNGRLYVAEESSGVEIFELKRFQAKKIGQFKEDRPILQIAVSKTGAFMMCGFYAGLKMYDVKNPADIKELYSYKTKILYGNNFAAQSLEDGTMVLFCHRQGLIYSNPEQGDDRFFNIEYVRKIGVCGYGAGEGIATDGKRILYTLDGGYVLLSKEHSDPFLIDTLPCHRAQNPFLGLLTLSGDRMVAVNRAVGKVYVLDVKELSSPRLIAELSTTASPYNALFLGDRILLPGGRSGLISLNVCD